MIKRPPFFGNTKIGGPLHYFGNRSLTLPDFTGRMKADFSWLKNAFNLVLSKRKGKKFKKCFEPFAGSAAWTLMAIEMEFSEEYYINDCNRPLIDFFISIKECPDLVKDAYSQLVGKYQKSKDKINFLLNTIQVYNSCIDSDRFLFFPFIVNHTWGGMVLQDNVGNIVYRDPDMTQEGVVGFLDSATLSIQQFREEIDRISDLFQRHNIQFQTGDFLDAVSNAGPGDFVQLNPPYPENKRSIEEKYGLYFELYSKEMLHEKICALIKHMDETNIAYFMSYGLHSPEIENFLVLNEKNSSDYFLREIGFKGCIFGTALERWYLSKDLTVSDWRKYQITPAKEFSEGSI